ncbi:MAG: chemotaxis response regulator protein-glutamate methylesterase, partial [Rickettsiales bacterium]|nr:chemotaxis response regulator protein-glutamate methylesterase [Rickettsiales bacterium]
GMGQDGMEGCKDVVNKGGSVLAQDEASCVVYGMPKAVADQGLCKVVLPLSELPDFIALQVEGRR